MAKNRHPYNSGRIHRAGTGGTNGANSPQPPRQNQNGWEDEFIPPPMQSWEDEYLPPPMNDWDEDEFLPPLPGEERSRRGGRGAATEARGQKAAAGKGGSAKKQAAAAQRPQRPAQKQAAAAAQRPAKKKRRWPKVLVAVVLVLAVGIGFGWNYISGVLSTDLLGNILPGNIPREYNKKDVVHILIIGIDNEEGRNYGAGLGLTDMLLYARFNLKDNQLSLLQIPRDSYVGEQYPTGGTGKINALLISGEDKDNPINNLVGVFQQQFQLPVDHYVALDMDAMKTIVNTFGGLNVYVPRDMNYGGSALPQGWQWLDGDQAEFFVRNRHGAGFERGDIDRLDNQRHFYSALFRRLLNLTPVDIVNLLPVFDHYCSTSLDFNSDMVALAVSALKLNSENVLFCKAPGATGGGLDPTGRERSLYIIDLYGRGTEAEPGLAALLNQYFRAPDKPVPAEELLLPQIQIPASYALYPPNVQSMGDVQAPEGGEDVNVEWTAGQ